MLFDLFEGVASTVSTATNIISDSVSTVVAPGPELRPEWDSEEGRIKIKIKDRNPFDPRKY